METNRSVAFSQIGSAPPAPLQFVGRENDLARLKAILINTPEDRSSGLVTLVGRLVREARIAILTTSGPLTQRLLADRSGISVESVKKIERGEPVKFATASAVAKNLGKALEELRAPVAEAVSVQTLIALRGLPGVGKTTAAAQIAHDAEIKHSFDGCLWASLGQSPEPLSELKAWGRALGVDIDQEKDKKYARARLCAVLSDKRMLIIIDDAWTSEPAFDLMVGGPRCATLVTTRIPEVADEIGPTQDDIYLLDVLTVDDAVKLLTELAASVVANHPNLARDLVKEVEYLPLALQVAGRLLRSEERKGLKGLGVVDLLKALRDPVNLLDKNAPGGAKIGALLQKSTDVLDPAARECFAYLAPFPDKPATFDQKALNSMWKGIAENPEEMRDLLISRGLLEPRGNGRFWLHALLVAHAKRLLS